MLAKQFLAIHKSHFSTVNIFRFQNVQMVRFEDPSLILKADIQSHKL